MNKMRIKAGCGYYDITRLPVGGDFRRAGEDGVELRDEIKEIKPTAQNQFVTCIATTTDGRRVALQKEHLEEVNRDG